jgi:hypothetical protein
MWSRNQGGRKGDDLFLIYCSDSGGPRGQLLLFKHNNKMEACLMSVGLCFYL